MAMMEQEESTTMDKKAARKAEKMKKKEEKKKKKAQREQQEIDNEEGMGGKVVIVLVTIVIVIVWLAILALLIKLDVGGFGSTVLHPMLKDVPYVSMILPETKQENVVDVQYPYATLEDAIKRIKELEIELSEALEAKNADSDTVAQLQAEISRLQKFEQEQASFQELKTEFYQEVVFSDNAPEIEEYQEYYESIDAANAAGLYKQVVQQKALDEEIDDYAETYAAMKPKQAAAIMEEMTDDLKLVAEILEYMDAEARGDILGAMDSAIAAKVTKLMKPE